MIFEAWWQPYMVPLVATFLTLAVTLVARGIVLRNLRRWAGRTATQVDDIVLQSVRVPSILWCVIIAVAVGHSLSALPANIAGWIGNTLLALGIASVTLTASSLLGHLAGAYGARLGVGLSMTTITQTLIRISVLVLGALVLLDTLHIQITSLLAALGVGSLAVALALQETLSNLFAGVNITLGKYIRVGDYIKLDSGDEGYVVDMDWRTTRIRALANNLIIIPNNKIAQSIVTNYHLPEPRMSLLISIGVSYDSDPQHVEDVLVDEAMKAVRSGEIPGLLAEPAPFVRFIPGFGDFSLNLTLICQVREFVDQYLAQHELRKRIFRRFNAEGIKIPFPVRTVYLEDGRQGRVDERAASGNR